MYYHASNFLVLSVWLDLNWNDFTRIFCVISNQHQTRHNVAWSATSGSFPAPSVCHNSSVSLYHMFLWACCSFSYTNLNNTFVIHLAQTLDHNPSHLVVSQHLVFVTIHLSPFTHMFAADTMFLRLSVCHISLYPYVCCMHHVLEVVCMPYLSLPICLLQTPCSWGCLYAISLFTHMFAAYTMFLRLSICHISLYPYVCCVHHVLEVVCMPYLSLLICLLQTPCSWGGLYAISLFTHMFAADTMFLRRSVCHISLYTYVCCRHHVLEAVCMPYLSLPICLLQTPCSWGCRYAISLFTHMFAADTMFLRLSVCHISLYPYVCCRHHVLEAVCMPYLSLPICLLQTPCSWGCLYAISLFTHMFAADTMFLWLSICHIC